MKQLARLVAIIAICFGSPLYAQKVDICVNFSSNDKILGYGDGRAYQATASSMTDAEKSEVLQNIASKFAPVVGAANVDVHQVTNWKDCGACSIRIIISGDKGPGYQYGSVGNDEDPAVIHEGLFRADGFAGATLVNAISENAAHLAGHLYGLPHTTDPNDLMTTSENFANVDRLKSQRQFSATEGERLREHLAECPRPTPKTGSVTLNPNPPAGTRIADGMTDLHLSLSGLKPLNLKDFNFGYLSTNDSFLDADDDDFEQSSAITLPGYIPLDFGMFRNQMQPHIFGSNTFQNIFLADGDRQAMIEEDLDDDDYADLQLFLAGLSGNFMVQRQYGLYGPQGRTLYQLLHFNFPNVNDLSTLVVSASSVSTPDGRYNWNAPATTRIVDVAMSKPYVSSLGDGFIHVKMLMNDGSVLILSVGIPAAANASVKHSMEFRFIGSYPRPSGADPYTTWNRIKGDPFILGANTIYTYDSTINDWKIDSAGLGSSYISDIALDSNQTLYATNYRWLYIQPQGETFHKSPATFNNDGGMSTIFIDSRNGIHITSSTLDWLSTDGGTTFVLDTIGLRHPTFNGVYRIGHYSEDAQGDLFAIPIQQDGQPGVFEKVAGASNWKLIAQSVAADVHDAAAAIFNDVTGDLASLRIATSFGSYVSTDHGTGWQKESTSSSATSYYSIAKLSDNTLLLGTDEGIFSGSRHSSAWQKRFPMTGYMSMHPLQLGQANLYIPFQNGLYQDANGTLYTLGRPLGGSANGFQARVATSQDKGLTWTEDSAGVAAVKGYGIYYVTPDGKQYIGGNSAGNYIYSKLAGGGWALDQAGYTPKSAYDVPIAFASSGLNTFLATSSANVWREQSGHWALDTVGLGSHRLTNFAAGTNGDMFAGTYNGDIMHWVSGTWTAIPTPASVPLGVSSFYLAVDRSGTLFADWASSATPNTPAPPYVGTGLYFSRDLGAHWTKTSLGNGVNLNGIYASGDTVYLLTDEGFVQTTGKLWATAHAKEGPLVHFDTTAPSHSSTRTITITNFGNDTLHISGIVSSGPFTVQSGPTTVAPGGVAERQVQFTPTSTGIAQGMAVITSNSVHVTDTVFFDGVGGTSSGVVETMLGFSLEQNRPNPFSDETEISYTLPETAPVTLVIADVLGRPVKTLYEGYRSAGKHLLTFESTLPLDGSYFYTLIAGSRSATRSMLRLK